MSRELAVRFVASAPQASSRGWMAGSLTRLELELLPLIAVLLWVLYPKETEIEMERCNMSETQNGAAETAQPQEETPKQAYTLEDAVNEIVSYHKPDEAGVAKITAIREATAAFIAAIAKNCPNGPDRSAAIRKAREAMMTANAAIVVPVVVL